MPRRPTSGENFQRLMRGEPVDRLPLDLPITPPVADLIERHTGLRDPVAAFDLDFHAVGVAYREEGARWREAYDALGIALPADAQVGLFGLTHTVPARESVGEAYHFTEMFHPLATLTDVASLERLPWPDADDPALYAHLPQQVEAIHEQGRVAAGQLACTSFEFSWYLRGMEELFMDLAEGNGMGEWLLDWFADRAVPAVRAFCQAGVDVVVLGDDVGTQRGMMMSVDYWRTHLRPRLARVVDAVREHGPHAPHVFYHSDGDIRPILNDLADIGIDIINPVQPECMPLDEVIPAHRHRLAFWGMIGTQTTMPFGTPDDVRAAVAACHRHARDGARIIVAPTHVLEPDVPWENIVALVEAVKQGTGA